MLRTRQTGSAVRDLERLNIKDQDIVDELLAFLADDHEEIGGRLSAATELCRLGHTKSAVENVIRMIAPRPWAELAAVQRFIEGNYSNDDASIMAEFVRIKEDDSDLLKQARMWLFNWLEDQVEPGR